MVWVVHQKLCKKALQFFQQTLHCGAYKRILQNQSSFLENLYFTDTILTDSFRYQRNHKSKKTFSTSLYIEVNINKIQVYGHTVGDEKPYLSINLLFTPLM
jgi:hypothetical protein